MTRALYAGSFDPVTNGHIDIIKRASCLFDEVYVAVAHNSSKKPFFTVQERKIFLKKVVSAEKLGNVTVDSFVGLTVDFARKNAVDTVIRGLRAVSDFEAEFQMVAMNRQLDPHIDTVFLMPSQDLFFLSSHLIKEIVALKGDVAKFVPAFVEAALKRKLSRRS